MEYKFIKEKNIFVAYCNDRVFVVARGDILTEKFGFKDRRKSTYYILSSSSWLLKDRLFHKRISKHFRLMDLLYNFPWSATDLSDLNCDRLAAVDEKILHIIDVKESLLYLGSNIIEAYGKKNKGKKV